MADGRGNREEAREPALRLVPVPDDDGALPDDDAATEQVRDLLAEHVPLSLLADLASPEGPPSEEILDAEGLPDEAWWDREGEDAVTPAE